MPATVSAQVAFPGGDLRWSYSSYPGLWHVLWSGRVKCPAPGYFIVVPLWWGNPLPISADCGLSAVSVLPTATGLWSELI